MKNNFVFIFIFLFHFAHCQTVYQDTLAPDLKFTQWINNSKGTGVLNDKHIVLEFWARWCGPCIKSFPHFNKLTEKYSNDITFIAVNSFETKDVVEKFLIKNNLSSFVALDENKYLYNAFDIQNIPVTIIIDKDGMLRWRGITTELTEDVLDVFLEKNIFHDNYNKGIIHDQEYSISEPHPITYNLMLEYGDQTKGKSLSQNFKEQFYIKLSNYSVPAILNSSSGLLQKEEEWKFEGEINKIINIEIETKNIEDGEIVFEDAINQLGKIFNFTIERTEVPQEILFIEYDSSRIRNFISTDQTLDPKVLINTEEYVKYQNVFFKYITPSISYRTNTKIEYAPDNFTKYDLTISKTDNINELKEYLKEQYGIKLIKKEKMVKVNKVTFY